MTLVSHSKKVKIFIHPFVLNFGLLPLCNVLYDYPDTRLILGFVER